MKLLSTLFITSLFFVNQISFAENQVIFSCPNPDNIQLIMKNDNLREKDYCYLNGNIIDDHGNNFPTDTHTGLGEGPYQRNGIKTCDVGLKFYNVAVGNDGDITCYYNATNDDRGPYPSSPRAMVRHGQTYKGRNDCKLSETGKVEPWNALPQRCNGSITKCRLFCGY